MGTTSSRTGLVGAVGLILAGSFLVVVGAGRDWAVLPLPGDALRGPGQVGVPGSELAAGVRALGLVGLAGVVAVAGSRGRGRLVVGAVLALAGVAAAVEAVRALLDLEGRVAASRTALDAGTAADPSATAWPWACLVGAVVLALAGLLVALLGRGWGGLSSRYEPPAPGPSATEPVAGSGGTPPRDGSAALWAALDRGEDPTRE